MGHACPEPFERLLTRIYAAKQVPWRDEALAQQGGRANCALVAEPQTNGVAERFNRTLKEQVFHGRIFQNLTEARVAVAEFKERYNGHWRMQKDRLHVTR